MVLCVIQIVCGRQQESNSPQHLSKMIFAILIYLLKFDNKSLVRSQITIYAAMFDFLYHSFVF